MKMMLSQDIFKVLKTEIFEKEINLGNLFKAWTMKHGLVKILYTFKQIILSGSSYNHLKDARYVFICVSYLTI